MAYDEALARRLDELLADRTDVSERKMFGGLALMVNGNMAVGVVGENLMVRVGRDAYEDALDLPDTQPMDFTGRPMKGFLLVHPAGVESDESLCAWATRGVAFALSLPAE